MARNSLFSMSTYATEGLGLSQSKGSVVQALLAAGQMVKIRMNCVCVPFFGGGNLLKSKAIQVGRPVLGILLDQAGRVNIAFISSLVAGKYCSLIMEKRLYFLVCAKCPCVLNRSIVPRRLDVC
jgi:hypothetical protein